MGHLCAPLNCSAMERICTYTVTPKVANCAQSLVSLVSFPVHNYLGSQCHDYFMRGWRNPLALHICEGQLVSVCLVHVPFVPIQLSTTVIPW
jgi:hypothetical protein